MRAFYLIRIPRAMLCSLTKAAVLVTRRMSLISERAGVFLFLQSKRRLLYKLGGSSRVHRRVWHAETVSSGCSLASALIRGAVVLEGARRERSVEGSNEV